MFLFKCLLNGMFWFNNKQIKSSTKCSITNLKAVAKIAQLLRCQDLNWPQLNRPIKRKTCENPRRPGKLRTIHLNAEFCICRCLECFLSDPRVVPLTVGQMGQVCCQRSGSIFTWGAIRLFKDKIFYITVVRRLVKDFILMKNIIMENVATI